jgi:hypothetical protein
LMKKIFFKKKYKNMFFYVRLATNNAGLRHLRINPKKHKFHREWN